MASPRMFLLALLMLPWVGASAQGGDDRFAKVEVEATAIRAGLYLLTGAGGNILLSIGDDGGFLVDDQYAQLNEKIRTAITRISDEPVRFILNTHFHGDHTGGNADFGATGVVIVAHDNVRKRLGRDQFLATFKRELKAAPAAALPLVTFSDGLTLHLNGEDVQAIHVAHAHTDGDALVWFAQANVLHMGDLYFNGLYPFIDVDAGGDIDGVIAGVDRALAMSDDATVIVPGHGPLSSKAELAKYGAMLKGFRARIAELKTAGKSLAETIAARPTQEFDAALGGQFIGPDLLVELIYRSL